MPRAQARYDRRMLESKFKPIELVMTEALSNVRAGAQARADDVGQPVNVRIDLVADGQFLQPQTIWVFPQATADQWSIIEGAPVRTIRPNLPPLQEDRLEESIAVLASSDGTLRLPQYADGDRVLGHAAQARHPDAPHGQRHELSVATFIARGIVRERELEAEVTKLRELVAFHKGCAEAAAEEAQATDG
jgi:hypothetical protein